MYSLLLPPPTAAVALTGLPFFFFLSLCWLVPLSIREALNWFCDRHGFAGWFETSAKQNINIDEASRFLVEKVLERVPPSGHPSGRLGMKVRSGFLVDTIPYATIRIVPKDVFVDVVFVFFTTLVAPQETQFRGHKPPTAKKRYSLVSI